MSTSPAYAVVTHGRINPRLTAETVVSNLVLSLGISEQKARQMLEPRPRLLKHFDSPGQAQRLLDLLEQAGLEAELQSPQTPGNRSRETSSQSSLLHIFGERDEQRAGNQSIFARLLGGRKR